MLALGLIETKGLIGAIEAADAMLKAADVRLLEKSLATGGLVTITVAGEVAAVQSAVDAAKASLERIEGVVCVSRHVIPRPDAGLENMLLLQPVEPKAQEPLCDVAVSGAQAPDQIKTQAEKFTAEPAKATDNAKATEKAPAAEEAKAATAQPRPEATGFSRDKCKTMSMNKLRQLAVETKVDLTREQVASANRQTLIDAIDRAARKEKE